MRTLLSLSLSLDIFLADNVESNIVMFPLEIVVCGTVVALLLIIKTAE